MVPSVQTGRTGLTEPAESNPVEHIQMKYDYLLLLVVVLIGGEYTCWWVTDTAVQLLPESKTSQQQYTFIKR